MALYYKTLPDGTKVPVVPFYQELDSRITAVKNCRKTVNTLWEERHGDAIKQLIDNLPHGSGIDTDWKLEVDDCSAAQIVFYASFHHMNENGMYDGWTDFTVRVKPEFSGISVKVSGAFPRKYSDVRDYLCEMLHDALTTPIYATLNTDGSTTYRRDER